MSATVLARGPLSVDATDRRRIGSGPADALHQRPSARLDVVRRPELLRRLAEARARPLVLLSAPAGYGKSILMAQWAELTDRPSAWLNLAGTEGDASGLTDLITMALGQIGVRPGLERSFSLVLDDAHHAAPEALQTAVLDLLAWLPKGSQVALGSRSELKLPLAQMRARRMVVEVRARDLAMSAAEAGALLRSAGADVAFTEVQDLVRRTEGWPVALELAACSLTSGPVSPGPPERFAGDDHRFSAYLAAEFLSGLSPETFSFLTRSSILDRLSGPACDWVLRRGDSAQELAELARSNLPLEPIDARHECYRVHGLFREMLHAELRRTEGELVPLLHQRAADWHHRAGEVDRAIHHSLRAPDLNCAGELLWAHLPGYLGRGEKESVRRWLNGVADERVAVCAPLAIVAAHTSFAAGDGAAAEQWARSAAVALATHERGATSQRAGVAIIEAWVGRRGTRGMVQDAARAYELLADDCPWRASACLLLGSAALLNEDRIQAQHHLAEGAARGELTAPDAASLCLAQLHILAAARDDGDFATDLAQRALALVSTHQLSEYPTSALVFAVSATACLREGRLDEAKVAAAHATQLIQAFDGSVAWYGAEVRILLGRVSLALGDVAGARELLAKASPLARRSPGARVFERWFDDAWAQLDLHAEAALSGVASLTTAELRILRFLPTHFSFHEIAERLHVSANTVKTHVHAVYRKLDVCSRSEAVARATDAGLLGG